MVAIRQPLVIPGLSPIDIRLNQFSLSFDHEPWPMVRDLAAVEWAAEALVQHRYFPLPPGSGARGPNRRSCSSAARPASVSEQGPASR